MPGLRSLKKNYLFTQLLSMLRNILASIIRLIDALGFASGLVNVVLAILLDRIFAPVNRRI